MCVLRKIGFILFFLVLNVQANKTISIFVGNLTSFQAWAEQKDFVETSSGLFQVLLNDFYEKKIDPTKMLDFYSDLSESYKSFSHELAIIKNNNDSDAEIVRYLELLESASDLAFNYVLS